MKILLSIKPEFAEKILDGKKQFEFRKVVFKNQSVKTVVIYATKPIGKIIGEFEVDEVIAANPDMLWQLTVHASGITEEFFTEYFRGRSLGYAIKVKKTKRYNKPIELVSILSHGYAPQSFCYI